MMYLVFIYFRISNCFASQCAKIVKPPDVDIDTKRVHTTTISIPALTIGGGHWNEIQVLLLAGQTLAVKSISADENLFDWYRSNNIAPTQS